MRERVGGNSVNEHGSISPHQEDPQLLEEVPHFLLLILPCAPSQCSTQLLDLAHCLFMPSAKGLNWQRDEGNTFTMASLQGVPALVIESLGESVTWGLHCLGQSTR